MFQIWNNERITGILSSHCLILKYLGWEWRVAHFILAAKCSQQLKLCAKCSSWGEPGGHRNPSARCLQKHSYHSLGNQTGCVSEPASTASTAKAWGIQTQHPHQTPTQTSSKELKPNLYFGEKPPISDKLTIQQAQRNSYEFPKIMLLIEHGLKRYEKIWKPLKFYVKRALPHNTMFKHPSLLQGAFRLTLSSQKLPLSFRLQS